MTRGIRHLAVLAASLATASARIMSQATLSDFVTFASTPDENQMMSLQIGLALTNTDKLEEKLRAISTPGSPEYGKYLSKEEVFALFPPASNAADTVTGWLQGNGVDEKHISQQGCNINFATTVGNANKLLQTSFAYYDVNGIRKLRTTRYSVPEGVHPYIQLIHPTTTFFGRTGTIGGPEAAEPSVEAMSLSGAATADNCAQRITPDCLRDAYNVDSYTPDPSSGSRLGFSSFLNQSARYADQATFQEAFNIPSQKFTVQLINGGIDNQNPDGDHGEANLDAQYGNAMSHPLPMTEFITGGSPPFVPNLSIPTAEDNTNEPYLEYYQYLMNLTNDEIPQVISNSYGDDEQTVPPDYATRVCDLIGMMGLRGITVLESSGDTGVGAPCMSNDGSNKPEFTPQFPATCPYVTSVGGTQGWAPEVAWVASSGGFSNYFAQPWYQIEAVKTYLDNNISPETKGYYEDGGFVNFTGRGFPDIAAHSLNPNYMVYNGGVKVATGGTSAAAPVVAGLFAMLNDARLRAGKPTMGFINPFLYSLQPGQLIDVAAGNSTGCYGSSPQNGKPIPGGGLIRYAYWNATSGWDPVTGMGLPDFQVLKEAALSVV